MMEDVALRSQGVALRRQGEEIRRVGRKVSHRVGVGGDAHGACGGRVAKSVVRVRVREV